MKKRTVDLKQVIGADAGFFVLGSVLASVLMGRVEWAMVALLFAVFALDVVGSVAFSWWPLPIGGKGIPEHWRRKPQTR